MAAAAVHTLLLTAVLLPGPGWQKKYIMQLTVDDVFLAYHRRLSK